ncbi:KAR9 [Candida oxycetoniae]|uniref:KAR9 n=1 Tax=Candida oxycetoniae TaxID=497107 RepID=A0AAI9SUX5_9ASCO|nr:KAR9 [Candida oxycetoniae]KAI3402969.2 KAR9 [Candida oxycetoniae]
MIRAPTLKLSHLLTSIANFSFFDELINITEPSPSSSVQLSQHDLFKINKVLDDIDLYLNDLIMVFNNIKQVSKNAQNLLDWYFEGKNALIDLLRNLDSIDSIISRLLLVVEVAEPLTDINQNNLIRKFEEASDLLLDVKKSSILLKKNLDISIKYHELIENVIRSLKVKIEDYIKSVVKLKEYKLTSPQRVLANFSLADIVSKMKINEFTSTNKIKSMRLPTFNDLDEKIYEEYMALVEKIEPLSISLNIVPSQIEEFNNACSQSLFQESREKVLLSYESMLDKWNYLQIQMKILKVENIDSKWNQIFNYLIEQIEQECNELIDVLAFWDSASCNASSVVNEDVGGRYKVCANSVYLIQNAIHENIITDKSLSAQFYKQLQPKWMEVNDLITRAKAPDPEGFSRKQHLTQDTRDKTCDSKGLRQFQTKSRGESQGYFERLTSNGLGIDFNVDVESVTMPLSVLKKDKMVDIFTDNETDKSCGKNLRNSLIQVYDYVNERKKEDEEETLVKTPVQQRKVTSKHSESAPFDITAYFENVLNSSIRKPSKLPRIHPSYIQLGYPVISKRKGYTQIPAINASHVVFQSPFRIKNGTSLQLSSPNLDTTVQYHRRNDPFYISRSRTSSTATVIGRPNSLLNEMKIPNLTYARKLSYNSASPERPLSSSLGSRYNDENLLKSFE